MRISISFNKNIRELKRVIKKVLQTGTTPQKITVTLLLGISFGMIPVIGVSTLLLTIIAIVFRLNMVIIQAVNYLVYPLQIILYLPFLKFSAFFFKIDIKVFHILDWKVVWQSGFKEFSTQFLLLHAGALIWWTILCVPVILIFYPILNKIIERKKLKMRHSV
jgi:uncharacterized protein (DUF2062 family)